MKTRRALEVTFTHCVYIAGMNGSFTFISRPQTVKMSRILPLQIIDSVLQFLFDADKDLCAHFARVARRGEGPARDLLRSSG